MKFFIKFATYLFLFLVPSVAAASVPVIYFHLPEKEVAPGSEFELSVFIDSDSEINALEAAIEFTPENLQFLGYNDSASIINVWQTKPTIKEGRYIILAGGMLEAYKGNGGEIIKLKFQTKVPGASGFALRESAAYLADGNGTQVSPTPFYIKLDIREGAPMTKLNETTDKTSPRLTINKIKDPEQEGTLLSIEVKDEESGSGQILVRNFKNWNWSEWSEVSSPVRLPEESWIFQIKAVNGVGKANSAFVLNNSLKQSMAGAVLILVLGLTYFLYNKHKPVKWF